MAQSVAWLLLDCHYQLDLHKAWFISNPIIMTQRGQAKGTHIMVTVYCRSDCGMNYRVYLGCCDCDFKKGSVNQIYTREHDSLVHYINSRTKHLAWYCICTVWYSGYGYTVINKWKGKWLLNKLIIYYKHDHARRITTLTTINKYLNTLPSRNPNQSNPNQMIMTFIQEWIL